MKNIKLILIAFLFMVMNMNAQTENAQNISLKQAIEIGLQNRYDTKANQLNIDIANNSTKKAKKEWLPDISATTNLKYNTQLQKMVFPSESVGSSNSNNYITTGTKNESSFSLDLTQNIFKPGLNTNIKIAKEEALLEKERNIEKETDIKLKISEIYLNTLLKSLQLKLANATTERYLQYFKITEDKFRLGVVTENDLIKTKLDYENSKITSLEASQNYDLSLAQLRYHINIGKNQQIILTDSIETLENEYATQELNLTSMERTEIKQLHIQANIYSLELRKSKQYFLPTISFFANYSTQFQGENFNYGQSIYWSPYNNIGVKLILPITGNFKNYNTIKEKQLKIQQNQFQLLQKQADITYDAENNKTELLNTLKLIASSKNNIDLSKKVFNTQLNTYKLGTVTYNSILDTESSLNTAEQNYIKAVYNYLIAKVNYEKSIGAL